MAETASITVLLDRLKCGDQQALDDLIPLVYPELRRMAGSYLRGERAAHTLQPTALVHEAYLRLAGQSHPDYQSRAHFFGVASQLMRQILVDAARRRSAAKRGSGGLTKVTLTDAGSALDSSAGLVSAVDDALQALERHDPLKARLIEMRFFGGLTAEESSGVLQIPVQTVRHQLRVAQAWLQRELQHDGALSKA